MCHVPNRQILTGEVNLWWLGDDEGWVCLLLTAAVACLRLSPGVATVGFGDDVGQSMSGTCSLCAAGLYGSTMGLTTSTCTDVCAAGYYGASAGQNGSTCSGPCAAGYICPPGSVNATPSACPAGQYSTSGSSLCAPCPAGKRVRWSVPRSFLMIVPVQRSAAT